MTLAFQSMSQCLIICNIVSGTSSLGPLGDERSDCGSLCRYRLSFCFWRSGPSPTPINHLFCPAIPSRAPCTLHRADPRGFHHASAAEVDDYSSRDLSPSKSSQADSPQKTRLASQSHFQTPYHNHQHQHPYSPLGTPSYRRKAPQETATTYFSPQPTVGHREDPLDALRRASLAAADLLAHQSINSPLGTHLAALQLHHSGHPKPSHSHSNHSLTPMPTYLRPNRTTAHTLIHSPPTLH